MFFDRKYLSLKIVESGFLKRTLLCFSLNLLRALVRLLRLYHPHWGFPYIQPAFPFSLTEGESLPDFSRAIAFVGTLATYSATGDVALPLRRQFPRLFIGRLYGSGYFKGIYLRRFSVFRIVFCRNWISKPLKQMPFFWCLTSFVCPKFFHLFPVFLLI